MKNIILSIVIPAYNAEPYLRKCVDSCIQQSGKLPEYEIVIVNDGSTDGTQAIIDEYLNANLNPNENGNKSPKISFISQPNGGLSKARNEGLKKCQGEYVWFVDADDWIVENALSLLTQIIRNNQPDVVTFRGYDWRNGIIKERRSIFLSDMKGLSGMAVLKKMGTAYWNPCVPFYLMKRQMLIDDSLQFMEGVIHEDSEFTPRMLYIAKTAYVTTELLYYVYQNPVSLNRKKNPEKAFHTLRVIDSLCKFSAIIPNCSDRRIFNDIIATTMNTAMKETKDMEEKQLIDFKNRIPARLEIFMLQSSKLKFRLEGLMLFVAPYILIKYIRKHQK